jgi:hypothetical protein
LQKKFSRDTLLLMVFFPERMPRCIFVACLALSVLGAFTFAAADFPSLDFLRNQPVTGGSVTSMDYTIDGLAEYSVRLRGCPSLPSRKSTHIIMPFDTLSVGAISLFLVMNITKRSDRPNTKNTIPLKLRI